MPIVRVTMAAGRTNEQKAALARDITASLAERCNADPSHIYVLFEDVPPDEWMVGGETITERRRKRGEL